MGRRVLRMNFSHPAWHIRIEARNKRNAGCTTCPRRADSRNRKAQHQRERNCDTCNANALRHVANRLNNALQNTDVVFSYGNQQCESCRNVEHSGNHAAPGHGAGHGSGWIANFVAHHRRELKSDQAETDHAKRIQHRTIVGRHAKISCAEMSAEAHPDHDAKSDQDGSGDSGSNRAHIVNPFPHTKACDVQRRNQRQQS